MSKTQQAHRRETYGGSDDLAVMQTAVNYNKYLLAFVMRWISKDQRVLDFGAGLGTFAVPLSQAEYDITCVELDPDFNVRLTAKGLNVVRYLDEIDDGSFDAIYSLNVLEHVQDDLALLKSLGTKLRPGGRLLLYVPAFQSLFSAMDLKVGHFRRYRRAQLARLTEEAGFAVRHSRYADSLGFFVTLLFKYLGNDSGDLNPTSLKFFDRVIFPLSRVADTLAWRFLGKNVWIVAERRE